MHENFGRAKSGNPVLPLNNNLVNSGKPKNSLSENERYGEAILS